MPPTPPSPPPPPPPYGPPVPLALAKGILAAAEREAVSRSWPMAIAVVDSTGHLLLFSRMDQTQLGSIAVAIAKAQTAVEFRRATKVFEDQIAAGGVGLRFATVQNITPVEGGLPLIQNGAVIGGIGVSGMQSAQDGIVAQAGVRVLESPGSHPR